MNRLFISLIFISSIFSQQTIAVLDFEGIGVSQEDARALSNRFGSEFLELAGYKYTLVERQAMGEILKEQGLQQSGCVSSECAVEVGAALGAQLIIIGSISKVGTIFSVNARMLDVETSRILKSINYDQVGDIGLLLTKGMREAAAKLLNIESEDKDLEDVTIEETDLESFEAWDAPPPERVKFIPYDDPPRPLTPIRPKYPQIAQERGIEGTVIVHVFVDKKGRVKETKIMKGIPNSGLDEAAIEAIKKTRFIPAKAREKKVGVWISIPVNFRLK